MEADCLSTGVRGVTQGWDFPGHLTVYSSLLWTQHPRGMFNPPNLTQLTYLVMPQDSKGTPGHAFQLVEHQWKPGQRNSLPTVTCLWESHDIPVGHIPDFVLLAAT